MRLSIHCVTNIKYIISSGKSNLLYKLPQKYLSIKIIICLCNLLNYSFQLHGNKIVYFRIRLANRGCYHLNYILPLSKRIDYVWSHASLKHFDFNLLT